LHPKIIMDCIVSSHIEISSAKGFKYYLSIYLMHYPRAVIERMLKRSNMRVSKGAVKEFGVLMEEITADLAAEAASSARQAKRKTILLEDVKKAVRMVR